MDLAQRRQKYQAIEAARGRPLIVYATSTRANVRAHMAADAVRQFIDQVDAIQNGDAIDILLHSAGGDPLAAWKLMSILRERFKKISVLVPFAAFSAATVFALGADEIVMHPHASLGPIDPQITVVLPDGKMRQFAYEDLGAFLKFLRKDARLTKPQHKTTIVDRLFSAVDPLFVGAAKRASDLAAEVGERLLSMHMEDKDKARKIAIDLNKSFFSHGDAVSRSRAKDLDLQVADSNPELEKLMWQGYLGIESYLELLTPFNPVGLYLANPQGAAALAPVAPLNLPPNTPPQMAQQVWGAAAQAALQAAQNPSVQVSYSLVTSLVESVRLASELRVDGFLTAFRDQAGNIQAVMVDKESRYRSV